MQRDVPPQKLAKSGPPLDFRPRFDAFFESLYARHTEALAFAEVRRALKAVSDLYVHKRHKLAAGDVFDGRGKRAAFALYYAPLHFLLTAHIVQHLGARVTGVLVDIGCGTGVGALAWVEALGPAARLEGFDRNAWATQEAMWNWRTLGHAGRAHRADASPERLSRLKSGDAVIAAFVINELPDSVREAMRAAFLAAHARGAQVLIIEPIAKTVADYWPDWEQAVLAAGGRCDEYKHAVQLPAQLRLLDKATGLRHDVLKGRSLYLPGHADAAARRGQGP